LAKIAHGFAVGEIGLSNLDPWLVDLIHDRAPGDAPYLMVIGRLPPLRCRSAASCCIKSDWEFAPSGSVGPSVCGLSYSQGRSMLPHTWRSLES
jgi:hypothetical protein